MIKTLWSRYKAKLTYVSYAHFYLVTGFQTTLKPRAQKCDCESINIPVVYPYWHPFPVGPYYPFLAPSWLGHARIMLSNIAAWTGHKPHSVTAKLSDASGHCGDIPNLAQCHMQTTAELQVGITHNRKDAACIRPWIYKSK